MGSAAVPHVGAGYALRDVHGHREVHTSGWSLGTEPLIFLPFPGNLVLAVLTAASAAIYMGCRPVHSGWSGVVGAFGMDIEKLTLRGGARAQPPLRLALLRVGRLGTFDPSVDDVRHPGGTFK